VRIAESRFAECGMHLVQEYGADETALLDDSIGRRVWQPPCWL